MDCSRRDFLKLLGLTVLASQLPIGYVEAYPNFNPDNQCGDYVLITDIDESTITIAKAHLYKQIRDTVPLKYRDQIVWLQKEAGSSELIDPFNQYGSVGWKYTPKKAA